MVMPVDVGVGSINNQPAEIGVALKSVSPIVSEIRLNLGLASE